MASSSQSQSATPSAGESQPRDTPQQPPPAAGEMSPPANNNTETVAETGGNQESSTAVAVPEAQGGAPPAIEVDPHPDEDSGYSDNDSDSYATSLLSSVRNYQFENGRRYHGFRQGRYLLPNDEQENERLDIYHHLCGLLSGGRLHRAPISNPQRILDIGCGTGIWAIQMGDDYPEAEVLGIDISPIQPSMVPPNVYFQIDDVEADWTFHRPFDFIHCRYMPACIADFPKLFRQAYQHLRPGGWIEFEDWDIDVYSEDGTLTPSHAFKRLHTLFIEACTIMGRVGSPGPPLHDWAAAAGFTNLTDTIVKIPFGTWPRDPRLKEIGAWNRLQIEQGLDGFAKAPLTRAMGWSMDEVEVFLVDIRKDCRDREIHPVYDYHIVTGQKPFDNQPGGAGAAGTAPATGATSATASAPPPTAGPSTAPPAAAGTAASGSGSAAAAATAPTTTTGTGTETT